MVPAPSKWHLQSGGLADELALGIRCPKGWGRQYFRLWPPQQFPQGWTLWPGSCPILVCNDTWDHSFHSLIYHIILPQVPGGRLLNRSIGFSGVGRDYISMRPYLGWVCVEDGVTDPSLAFATRVWSWRWHRYEYTRYIHIYDTVPPESV